MRISAAVAVWLCAAFAAVALGVALTGFSKLDTIADSAEREAAIGYIGFWGFLGGIAVLFGVLSWLMKRGTFGPLE